MRVIVINHLSLDGVLQAPGAPDEDTRGGFRHGGWAARTDEPETVRAMGQRLGEGFSWLFGRRTYDELLRSWNEKGGPFKDSLNATPKYVVSSRADTELPWPHTTLVTGDVPAEVASLRDQPGGNLVVMGSGELVRSLLPHRLVDEMLLMIHPVVLGSGRRLFGPDPDAHAMRLVEATPTATGVLLATYRPA